MSPPEASAAKAVSSPLVPATARGEATRRKLLAAAEEEFGSKGFHAASVSSITLRAGVGQGTFYLYFHTKEEVFTIVVQGIGYTLRRQMAQAASRHPDRERACLESFLEFTLRNPGLFRIVQESPFVDEAAFRDYYESLARSFGACVRPGASDVDTRAWTLMSVAHFLGMRHCIWQGQKPDEQTFEEVLRLLGQPQPTLN